MSARKSERAELETELERLQNTPTPGARTLPPGDPDRLNHPQVQRIINRQLERMRVEAEEILDLFTPEIRVDVAPSVIPAPEVRVEASVIPAPQVRVDVPDMSAALAMLESRLESLERLFSQYVSYEMSKEESKMVKFDRDQQGRIMSATVTEA